MARAIRAKSAHKTLSIGAKMRLRREKKASIPLIALAKKYASVSDELKGLSKKKTLTKQEQRRVTFYDKKLRHAPPLLALKTKKERAKFKHQKFPVKGIQALGASQFPEGFKAIPKGDDLLIKGTYQTWLLWKLDKDTVKNKKKLHKAVKDAWTNPQETLLKLTEKGFKDYEVLAMRLWTVTGIAGPEKPTLEASLRYIIETWEANKYVGEGRYGSDPGKWLNGLAFLIKDTVPPKMQSTPYSSKPVSEMG